MEYYLNKILCDENKTKSKADIFIDAVGEMVKEDYVDEINTAMAMLKSVDNSISLLISLHKEGVNRLLELKDETEQFEIELPKDVTNKFNTLTDDYFKFVSVYNYCYGNDKEDENLSNVN